MEEKDLYLEEYKKAFYYLAMDCKMSPANTLRSRLNRIEEEKNIEISKLFEKAKNDIEEEKIQGLVKDKSLDEITKLRDRLSTYLEEKYAEIAENHADDCN